MDGDTRMRSPDRGIALDDYRFHQCVRLSKFDTDREITFIPPDGNFELMTYRITENIDSPFKLLPGIKTLGRNRLEREHPLPLPQEHRARPHTEHRPGQGQVRLLP